MERILVAWIGGLDIDNGLRGLTGPIHSSLQQEGANYSHVYLLCNYAKTHKDSDSYSRWLSSEFSLPIYKDDVELSSPQDYGEIYLVADSLLSKIQSEHPKSKITLQISPGTPAMQAVWVLLGKTKYPHVIFLQGSVERGIQEVNIPFNISAEFQLANSIADFTLSKVSTHSAFDDIFTQNDMMIELKQRASVLACHNIPVLIQGASGTGKELFATAIHNASNRNQQPLYVLNCGAIPKELIDSTLFGHKKGSFTGAIKDQKGIFEQANGSSLFLDEFGELPLDAQIRLLRVLQEGTLNRVGDVQEIKVDVRLICATNKDLLQAVANGEFREDLFYRVAVGVLNLPPIKNRSGDITLLANALLTQIAKQLNPLAKNDEDKKLSPNAINLILKHSWPGNVRELHSTLLRAYLWSQGGSIDEQDLKAAMFPKQSNNNDIFSHDLSNPIDLQEILDEVEEYYLRLAWQKTLGKKTKASELLGIKSYQNYSNRLEKFKIN